MLTDWNFDAICRYPEEYFGLPDQRRFPMYTKEELMFSIEHFLVANQEERAILAKNLTERAHILGIGLEPKGQLSFYFKNDVYIKESYMNEASNFGTIEPIVGAVPVTQVPLKPIRDDDDEYTRLEESIINSDNPLQTCCKLLKDKDTLLGFNDETTSIIAETFIDYWIGHLVAESEFNDSRPIGFINCIRSILSTDSAPEEKTWAFIQLINNNPTYAKAMVLLAFRMLRVGIRNKENQESYRAYMKHFLDTIKELDSIELTDTDLHVLVPSTRPDFDLTPIRINPIPEDVLAEFATLNLDAVIDELFATRYPAKDRWSFVNHKFAVCELFKEALPKLFDSFSWSINYHGSFSLAFYANEQTLYAIESLYSNDNQGVYITFTKILVRDTTTGNIYYDDGFKDYIDNGKMPKFVRTRDLKTLNYSATDIDNLFITEASLPTKLKKVVEVIKAIKVDKHGNIRLDLRDKLTFEHYNDVHRVAIVYRDNKNLEGMKDIAAYAFSIIATIEANYTKKRDANKQTEEYSKMVRLRALWINDFKLMMKLIHEQEPKFDFMEYYKSKGYDKKIFIISKDALKFLALIFKTITKI